jgi:hypothetical protein
MPILAGKKSHRENSAMFDAEWAVAPPASPHFIGVTGILEGERPENVCRGNIILNGVRRCIEAPPNFGERQNKTVCAAPLFRHIGGQGLSRLIRGANGRCGAGHGSGVRACPRDANLKVPKADYDCRIWRRLSAFANDSDGRRGIWDRMIPGQQLQPSRSVMG